MLFFQVAVDEYVRFLSDPEKDFKLVRNSANKWVLTEQMSIVQVLEKYSDLTGDDSEEFLEVIKAKSIDPTLKARFDKVRAQFQELRQRSVGGNRDIFKVDQTIHNQQLKSLAGAQSAHKKVLYESCQVVLRESQMIRGDSEHSGAGEIKASLSAQPRGEFEVELAGADSEHSDIS